MRNLTTPRYGFLIAAASTLLLLCTLSGCSEDSPDTTSSNATSGEDAGVSLPDPDGRTVSASKLNSAVSSGRNLDQQQNAAVTPQAKAQLPELDKMLTAGRDLTEALVGKEGSISFDIDEDGQNESIHVFIATLDMNVFLSWKEEGKCYLAWEEDADDTGWLLIGPCDVESEDEVIICTLTDTAQTCNQCKSDNVDVEEGEEACQQCLVADGEVRCTPESRSNSTMDAGTPDSGGTFGECDPSCMSQSGAVCCMECGCEGAIKCLPECAEFEWDCESQCCFDYDVVACAGTTSTSNGTTATSNGTTSTSNGTTSTSNGTTSTSNGTTSTSNGTTSTSNGTTSTSNGTTGSGTCNESCMSQSGAVCCTECGCSGEVRCMPECGSFTWDCEVGCCFDYDAVQCVE